MWLSLIRGPETVHLKPKDSSPATDGIISFKAVKIQANRTWLWSYVLMESVPLPGIFIDFWCECCQVG